MVFPTQSTDTKRYAFITNACLKYEGICALVLTQLLQDQRVHWHTTPFEERLLKVLSDEEHRPPRSSSAYPTFSFLMHH
jgi:hypothetical protein